MSVCVRDVESYRGRERSEGEREQEEGGTEFVLSVCEREMYGV